MIPPCNRVNVSTCLKVKDMFSMSSSKFWIVSGLKEAQRMLGRSRSQTQVLPAQGRFFYSDILPASDQSILIQPENVPDSPCVPLRNFCLP